MQKYREIESADYLEEDEKLAAFGAIMGTEMKTETGGPSAWAKLQSCLKSGLALDDYLDLKEGENGTDTRRTKRRALRLRLRRRLQPLWGN
jgi:hypothetical protein